MALPQARVVRKGGQMFPRPPAPPRPRGKIAQGALELLSLAVGLWPLTCVVLLMFGLLIMAGNSGSWK